MLHEFVNELCPSRREKGVNYLLKAVRVQLRLVYYLNCHLKRERGEKNSIKTEWYPPDTRANTAKSIEKSKLCFYQYAFLFIYLSQKVVKTQAVDKGNAMVKNLEKLVIKLDLKMTTSLARDSMPASGNHLFSLHIFIDTKEVLRYAL